MKQHPVVGERICSPLKSFRLVLPIIRHHHEKLDGSGYPDGLKGNEIPLTAIERCLASRGKTDESKSILIVEDDCATREYFIEMLKGRGFEVRTAADGEQARAQTNESLPALVILDLILPNLSGLQLIAEWRCNSRTAEMPVFVLTNKDLTQNEKEYLRANTEALFSKQEEWLDALLKQIKRSVP
jgi:response regulator RpfG family c-di-GMP phosphodiesterase